MQRAFSVVGRPTPRVDGVAKVTGAARYVGDIWAPGMLWGKCLRSPHTHARIVHVDVSAARRLPGVRAVLTGRDIPLILVGRSIRDLPVLARDRVRFVGERVAAVAAEHPEAVEEALLLIGVEYEELPAVLDPEAAMRPDAPVLHPDLASYAGLPAERPADLPNVVSHLRYERGDVEAAFAGAYLVREDEFATQTMHQGYIERHACAVELDESGRIVVWINNKTPFVARAQLAAALGVEPGRIVVRPAPIGGDFGGKGSLMDLPVAYYLAREAGAAVRMELSAVEELGAANPRHPARIRIRSAVDRDGRLLAREARVVFDSGAYGAFKPHPKVSLGGAKSAMGLYRLPSLRLDVLMVYTNNVPHGHMRTPGEMQTLFASESHTDLLARQLGMDPLEFRLLNARRDGDLDVEGHVVRYSHNAEALESAGRAIGWGGPKAPGVGRGLAIGDHSVGGGESSARLEIAPDGRVSVHTAMTDTGTGAHTVIQQVVAEELGVPAGLVSIRVGSTDDLPADSGAGASRVTRVAGRAALEVGREAGRRMRALVAEVMGWQENRVALRDGAVFVEAEPEQRLLFAEAAALVTRANGGPLVVEATFREPETSYVNTVGVQAVEVEVDRETGQARVRRAVTVHDPATVVNPVAHQGQIEGGFVQGLGYAVMEELVDEGGRITTLSLGEYKLPCMADIPELETVLLPGTNGEGPYKAKGIGEVSGNMLAAAVANAIDDAVEVRLRRLPLKAEAIWEALQQPEDR